MSLLRFASATRRTLPLACSLLLLASPASANVFYVDSVNGDDTNSGTSAQDPWRHISHALSVIPAGSHQIRLAPGEYSAATGELLPLPIQDGLSVVGEEGSDATTIRGNAFQVPGGVPDQYSFQLIGVSLLDGDFGVSFFNTFWLNHISRLEMVDVKIRNKAQFGFWVEAAGLAEARMTDVKVRNCAQGALLTCDAWVGYSHVDVHAQDSVFSGNEEAVHLRSYGKDWDDGTAVFERCSFRENGTGIRTRQGDGLDTAELYLQDCLVVDNSEDGIDSSWKTLLDRCTVAGNLGDGYRGNSQIPLEPLAVRSTVFWNNGDNHFPSPLTMIYSRADASDLTGGVGNLDDPPAFLAEVEGDYRLRFDSPLVDGGVPNNGNGELDIAGNARRIDGNLDTFERVDIGAFELTPLGLTGEARIGGTVELELWGGSGTGARVFMAPVPLVASVPTPFGELVLNRPLTVHHATTISAPGPPNVLPVAIPNDGALIGTSWSFQSLSRASSSTTVQALTNGVEFVIQP